MPGTGRIHKLNPILIHVPVPGIIGTWYQVLGISVCSSGKERKVWLMGHQQQVKEGSLSCQFAFGTIYLGCTTSQQIEMQCHLVLIPMWMTAASRLSSWRSVDSWLLVIGGSRSDKYAEWWLRVQKCLKCGVWRSFQQLTSWWTNRNDAGCVSKR